MTSGLHDRRSLRLKGYDYAQPGAYFVTVCANHKEHLFGEVAKEGMILCEAGRIIEEEWLKTAMGRPYIKLDQFVVMPNHVHGIIWIVEDIGGTARCAPTVQQFGTAVSASLPAIIRAFKSAATKRINVLRHVPGAEVWQRGFYEHVIRDDESLNRIREYIVNNPRRWDLDREKAHRKGDNEFYQWLANFKDRPAKPGSLKFQNW
jgi:putative transposase